LNTNVDPEGEFDLSHHLADNPSAISQPVTTSPLPTPTTLVRALPGGKPFRTASGTISLSNVVRHDAFGTGGVRELQRPLFPCILLPPHLRPPRLVCVRVGCLCFPTQSRTRTWRPCASFFPLATSTRPSCRRSLCASWALSFARSVCEPICKTEFPKARWASCCTWTSCTRTCQSRATPTRTPWRAHWVHFRHSPRQQEHGPRDEGDTPHHWLSCGSQAQGEA